MERDALTMLVARNIEAIMTRKGTNAAEVARHLGTNPTLVYDILSGKSRNPRLDTLHKIAVKGLGVPVSALLYEPTDQELDQELVQAFASLPPADRTRLLAMIRAYVQQLGPA
ncbi:MAG: helix-turn-helix domain-containing protein [Rhodospirillales bacterium]|nr:helix-turn-helix domain-containing protein [Rhodospirillales bacterium]